MVPVHQSLGPFFCNGSTNKFPNLGNSLKIVVVCIWLLEDKAKQVSEQYESLSTDSHLCALEIPEINFKQKPDATMSKLYPKHFMGEMFMLVRVIPYVVKHNNKDEC